MKLKQFNKRLGDGAWLGVPMQTYQDAPGLSSSMLRVLLESPLTYKRMTDGQMKREATGAMEFGTCQHSSVFEKRFDFHIQPATYGIDDKPWSANAAECKRWAEAHHDKPVLTIREATQLNAATDYIHKHPKAGKLIMGGHAEVSFFANGEKARCDYIKIDGEFCDIVDLKTCADASTAEFGKEIYNRGYHIQAAWYRRVLKSLGLTLRDFYIIALQKGQLPLVNVRPLSQAALALGDMRCEAAVLLLSQCNSSNYWPEWTDDEDDGKPKVFDVPEWCKPNTETELTFAGEQIAV